MSRDPQTPDEWREAVDAAQVLLEIDSARQYGLITGGPIADVERCAALLARGRELGYQPDPNAFDQFLAAGRRMLDRVAEEHGRLERARTIREARRGRRRRAR